MPRAHVSDAASPSGWQPVTAPVMGARTRWRPRRRCPAWYNLSKSCTDPSAVSGASTTTVNHV